MGQNPDMTVEIVDDNPDASVMIVGGQVVTATPADVGKVVTVNGDGELVLAAGTAGGIQSIIEGTGIDVDATDPDNPIVSALISSIWEQVFLADGTTVAGATQPHGAWSAAGGNIAITADSGAYSYIYWAAAIAPAIAFARARFRFTAGNVRRFGILFPGVDGSVTGGQPLGIADYDAGHVEVQSHNATDIAPASQAFVNGTWYELAVLLTGSEMSVYIDGVLMTTGRGAFATNSVCIGLVAIDGTLEVDYLQMYGLALP